MFLRHELNLTNDGVSLMSIFSASECAIGLANTIGTLKATKILQCNVFGLLHADAGSFEREKKNVPKLL